MLAPEFVILATLKVGVVYKIQAPEYINTNEPHYFIVVAINNADNFLILSTTKLHKKIAHIGKRGYSLDTIAYLEPNKENGLTEKSYFNCNEYYIITKEQLIQKVRETKLSATGNISEEEYNKLINAINLSIVNDIPKKLLVFTQD